MISCSVLNDVHHLQPYQDYGPLVELLRCKGCDRVLGTASCGRERRGGSCGIVGTIREAATRSRWEEESVVELGKEGTDNVDGLLERAKQAELFAEGRSRRNYLLKGEAGGTIC